ncbi:hypothetical protein [Devosia equisanguinis]|nr:hypothetical protein [Devosia equisanguinis]
MSLCTHNMQGNPTGSSQCHHAGHWRDVTREVEFVKAGDCGQ